MEVAIWAGITVKKLFVYFLKNICARDWGYGSDKNTEAYKPSRKMDTITSNHISKKQVSVSP